MRRGGRKPPGRKECQVDFVNMETAEIIRIAIVAVVLLGGLVLLKFALKIATRVLALGCLGIVAVLAVLVVLAMAA